jgi:hypothetical protein
MSDTVPRHNMPDNSRDIEKRVSDVEKQTDWLGDRLWYGTGNLHDRTHKLEDQRIAEEMDRAIMKEDLKEVKQVLGLNSYGGKNILTDLRDMIDTVEKLKGNVISTKDFHTLMNKVDILEKRGQAQITLLNVIQFGIISAIIGLVMDVLGGRLFVP